MKRKITTFVAFISYWLGVDAVFYWLNRKAKRIVTFHNVLPDDIFRNDIANGVSCADGDFRKIVHELKKRRSFSTDIFDSRSLTITFDDGYLNQYEIAAKILSAEGDIPAIIFPSGDVANGQTLLVDKLLYWVAHVPKEVINSLGFVDGRELWVKKIRPDFAADVEGRGANVYHELDRIYQFEKI